MIDYHYDLHFVLQLVLLIFTLTLLSVIKMISRNLLNFNLKVIAIESDWP